MSSNCTFIQDQTIFMKKSILLLLLFQALVAAYQVQAAGYTIGNQWRWSRDSGSIASRLPGTWLKPVNVAPVISMPGALRLRLLNVVEKAYSLQAADTLVLEYRVEPPSNSRITIESSQLNVNATSPTAGDWQRVEVGSPVTSLGEFVIDPAYDDSGDDALKNGQYAPSIYAHLLYENENSDGGNGTPGILPARHENLKDLPRNGAISLSKFNKVFSGSIFGFSGVPAGGLEMEYRIVATKNAKPGTVYYFRLRNVRRDGDGAGTVDAWDYASGYPSIATSADFNGALNTILPDVSVAIPTGFGSYATGVSRNGVIRITNTSRSTATAGPIKIDITTPVGWNFNIASPASGWTYSSGVLQTSSVSLAPGAGQNFTYSLVNSNAGFAASFLRAAVDRTVTIDGNGANNAAYTSVFKQL